MPSIRLRIGRFLFEAPGQYTPYIIGSIVLALGKLVHLLLYR